MTGTARAGSYRALLSRPHVLRVALSAAFGRCGYAMLPLLLLFTLRDASASFTTATTALSAFGLTGLVNPAQARLIDLYGQARVLPLLAAGTLLLVAALVALAATGADLPPATWVALTVAAGLAAPPLGPSMRAQWRVIAADDIDTAYALDGTMEEVVWLSGPALAGLLLTVPGPTWGLAVVPVLLAVGAVALSTSPYRPRAARAAPGQSGVPSARPALASRALWPILTTMLLTGASTALALTGVAAVADAVGNRGLAALGEVALGVGAVAGGFAWGHRRPSWRRRTSTGLLILVWAVTVLTVSVVGVGAGPLTLLAVAGAASAPVWVLAYGAADAVVGEGARTEASTWVTTAAGLGSSAGTALTGLVLATAGPRAPLAAAGAVALAAAAATVAFWRGEQAAG